MPEAPRRAWDRFSGCHFAGMNDHDSFVEACGVLRKELEEAFDASDVPIDEFDWDPVFDQVFGAASTEKARQK